MITILSIVLFGFLLGIRHAMDPDHVIAVTTIVSRERKIKSAAMIGALWGVGHTFTILLAGAFIFFFGVAISPRTGMALEFVVALMLVALGILNLKGIIRWIRTNINGAKGTDAEVEIERDLVDRATDRLDRRFGGLKFYTAVRPLIVGVVHGLAGSAALALLVLPMIHEPHWAMGYLVVFGLGTIAGMIGITMAMAIPFTWTARCSAAFHRHLGFAAGLVSLGFGLFLMYQIGFVQGLFTR